MMSLLHNYMLTMAHLEEYIYNYIYIYIFIYIIWSTAISEFIICLQLILSNVSSIIDCVHWFTPGT